MSLLVQIDLFGLKLIPFVKKKIVYSAFKDYHTHVELVLVYCYSCTLRAIFQLSVKSNPGLHWFCFTMLCDWSKNLLPLSGPIKCKTETNHDFCNSHLTVLQAG